MMRVVHHIGMQRIDPQIVAGEVRAHLARRDLGKKWLAETLGVSVATVNRRLAGKSAFTLAEVSTLAEALGIPVSALLLDEPVSA